MNDLLERLSSIEAEANKGCPNVSSIEDVKLFRAKFLGKSGLVTELLKMLGTIPATERPIAGKKINELKELVQKKIDALEAELSSLKVCRSLSQSCDITLPGRSFYDTGSLHPSMQIMQRMQDVFARLNFSVFEGPEIETDHNNFEALNVPKDHPARDMQDTFYVEQKDEGGRTKDDKEFLLRTHTSPVQIHVMKKFKPPLRMIFPGAVYRKDSDITHSPMFHQVEGLMVDEFGKVKMSHLKGVLTEFIHQMFGPKLGVRFRPSFFPFTEPSAEVDMECIFCGGKGSKNGEPCRLCKQTGWIEVLGCGMVDPNVFKAVGYDPKKYSGFAFGMGVERLAMLKLGVSDIRLFFENDLRFLKQF